MVTVEPAAVRVIRAIRCGVWLRLRLVVYLIRYCVQRDLRMAVNGLLLTLSAGDYVSVIVVVFIGRLKWCKAIDDKSTKALSTDSQHRLKD